MSEDDGAIVGAEPGASADSALLRLAGIGKSYSGIWVVREVSFAVRRGEIVALMGENGAGKSTLKNILCGLVAPDTGSIGFQNRTFPRLTTELAGTLGIAAIHQELSLFPNLSIAENIHMGVGMLPTRGWFVDNATMHREARALLGELFDRDVDPGQPVERLSLAERQLVEVAKALRRASTMLIFDEPTTSLSLPERRRLFEVVRRLRAHGYAIVYITHFMEEVYELADRIVVVRDGRMVGGGTPAEIDRRQLSNLMVGRELAGTDANLTSFKRGRGAESAADVILRVRDLADGRFLRGVTFELYRGEILGLAGLMGAGRSEVAEAVFGIRAAAGTVEICGEPFEQRTPEAAKARGVALVSEDRRGDQIFAGRSVRENLTSAILARLSFSGGLMSVRRQRRRAREMVDDYAIRVPGLEAPMVALSGGNQQKCVIARWLATNPRVCILDEPTKGIDVKAKAEIHALVDRLAAEGLGVLLISSDLPELLGLSHRLLIMHKGQIVGALHRDEFDPNTVVQMASTGRRL